MNHGYTCDQPAAQPAKSGQLRLLLIFLPPALLLFTIFVMLPMLNAALFAPYKCSGYGAAPWVFNRETGQIFGEWVGTRNFEKMAGHSAFAIASFNTLKVIAVSLLIQLPLALFLALLIYEKSYANTIFRLIFSSPASSPGSRRV
jgi:raffinose/stachyose/melibiose transport system permease protein